MSERIVIVGGVAAGASAAAKARRMSEDVEIVMLDAGPYVSFANCGLPYHVGGEIAERDDLLIVSAEQFRKRFNVDVRVNSRVTAIDRDKQTVTVNHEGESSELSYDRLLLATGTTGIRPPIAGLDADNIFTVRTVPDVDAITAFIDESKPQRALVIGGGYIGLETAEQLLRRGLAVTIIEMADQLMLALDPEMAWPLEDAFARAGGEVIVADGVAEIANVDGQSVAMTRSGRRAPFDIGILAVGVRPNVELAAAAGLTLGNTGAIAVDALQRTNDPAIYAAGDNSEARHLVLNRPVNLPLAGPANKSGRAAGANMVLDLQGAADDDMRRLTLKGVLGTAIVRVEGVTAACTGLTETAARMEGLDVAAVHVPGKSHAGYYPGATGLVLKVVYEVGTGRLLGAQAVGGKGADKRIDVIAAVIGGGGVIDDLEQLDLCYAPPFGSAKDLPVMAGFAGANARRGLMPSVTPAELLDELAGDNPPLVLDVRTDGEFAKGHLDGVLHIPVDEVRERLDEIPADGAIAVHCAAGYRSYLAQRILINSGRDNVRNISGGYTMIARTQAARR